jgi:hypothetical protein
MSKGSTKHEAAILSDVQSLLATQSGVIAHDQLLKIIAQYYSETYSKRQGQQAIVRELCRRNIAVLVNVKLPNAASLRTSKHSPRNPVLSVLIDATVPSDRKQTVISAFLRTFLPVFTPPMRRTVLPTFDRPPPQKRTETIEFPSMHFRSMVLHRFLLDTFQRHHFSIDDLSRYIPINLKLQILRNTSHPFSQLSLITKSNPADLFELDILLPTLRPPYHPLLDTNNVVNPVALVEIPSLGLFKKFFFFKDPAAYSTYWILFFAFISEHLVSYPRCLCVRFEPFVQKYFNTVPVFKLPFFPREVETAANLVGVAAAVVSFVLRKLFKRKLRAITCTRDGFADSKLFPSSGFAGFLATGSSLLPIVRPLRCSPLSEDLRVVEGSLRSFARLAAASRLSTQGYVVARDQAFAHVRQNAAQFLLPGERDVRAIMASLGRDPGFRSLLLNETARLIAEMRTPCVEAAEVEEEKEEEKSAEERECCAEFAAKSERLLGALLAEIAVDSRGEQVEAWDLNAVFTSRIPKAVQAAVDESPGFERYVSRGFCPEVSVDRVLVFDYKNAEEVTQSEFLAHFTVVLRARDLPVSVSVAAEFLKIVLRETDESLAALKTRQLAHLLQSDLSAAVFILDACDLYRSHERIRVQRSNWSFPGLAEEPHPQSIAICAGNDPTVRIVWKHSELAPIIALSWIPVEPQIEDRFAYSRIRSTLPRLQGAIVEMADGPVLYDSDPLLQFAFGQWEVESGEIAAFEQRYVLGLLNAAGVDGLTCEEIVDAFGKSVEQSEVGVRVMRIIYRLMAMELIGRVPTGGIVARFSRFLAPNMIVREVDEKMALVGVHAWVRVDGSVDAEKSADLRKKIAVFVFGHEF